MSSESEKHTRFYRGRSMRNAFELGDCITVISTSLDNIHPGDIVVYRCQINDDSEEAVVHRVMATMPGGLVTRGDDNPSVDMTLVTADNLLGQVTHVARGGITRAVRGGRLGLLNAQIFRVRRHVLTRLWRLSIYLGHRPYRWLRDKGLIARLWQPSIVKMRLGAGDDILIKYVCDGQAVARWWPKSGRFNCQKPYDLVLKPEDPSYVRDSGGEDNHV